MSREKSTNTIMDSLRRIVRALRTASRISERELGLRTAQAFVLQQLNKFEPMSLNELAEKTYAHQSTVSVVVNTLVEAGYIRRTSSKADRRRLVLETTAQGRALLRKRRPTIQEKFSEAIGSLSDKDRAEFSRLLVLFVTKAGMAEDVPHFFFEKESTRKPAKKKKTQLASGLHHFYRL